MSDLAPIPLTAPSGEILAYACPRCRQVPAGGHYLAPPDAARRAQAAESSRANAARCCLCDGCGKPNDLAWGRCSACVEKERPAQEARRAEEEAAQSDDGKAWIYRMTPILRDWANDWPLTVVGARDGLGYAAFPLEREEVPVEITERLEALEWLDVHGSDLFGLADTPEKAVADLRAKAKAIKEAA